MWQQEQTMGVPTAGIAGGSMLGGALAGMFGADPYKAAGGYLGQIPGALGPMFQPYMQAGQAALPQLQQQYGQLIGDPGALMGRIGAGFKQSPGYQYNVGQAMRAANQAAAAGGMTGSPAEQTAAATTAHGLASQDFQNYLNQALGMYQTGLGGLSGMAGMGLQAGTTYGQDLGSALESQAKLAYAQQAQKQKEQAGLFGGLGGMAGGFGELAGLALLA